MQYRPEAILSNTRQVLDRIASAARSAGRQPADVRLVLVTKGHPAEAVAAAMAAGLSVFGENYAEEGIAKMQEVARLRASVPSQAGAPGDISWHMIGHIQSRKAALVSEHYHYVHSLDSLKLAQRLDRFAAQTGRRLPVLLECNVSGEASKFGFPAWQEETWPALAAQLAALLALPNLEVGGLMTMAPFFDEPERARPLFRVLRRLRDFLSQRLPQASWSELSMGMSGDFEAAVQEGATQVRVGTAILGARPSYAETL
jgi:pyridoxal phosphate enzyme (YggS family)